MTKYLINWDNGVNACGTFPWVFDTYKDAEAAADRIYADNIAEGVWAEEDDPGVEVIEQDEPDPEEIDAAEEQTLDYFNRYIAGDR